MTTFVTVGNATQPFSRLIDAIGRIAGGLPQPVVVQHGSTPVRFDGTVARRFIDMLEFEELVARAHVLIMHAGAGSVIHAVRAGKVPVIMPRRVERGEHVDNHQVEFAVALASTGKVVVALEVDELEEAVRRAIARQSGFQRWEPSSLLVALVQERLQKYAAQR